MSFIRNFSIRNKLITLILLTGLPSIIIGYSYIIFRDVQNVRKSMVKKIQLEAALVGRYCIVPMTFSSQDGVREVLENLRDTLPYNIETHVYNKNGKLFGSYYRNKPAIIPSAPQSPRQPFVKFEGNFLKAARKIVRGDGFYGYIYMISSAEELPELTGSRIFSLLLVMLGSIILSTILALRFQRVISEPILKLARVTEKISTRADYSVRVQKEGNDEIGILYDGFNNMLEQIQLWEKKRDMAETEQIRLLDKVEEKNKELEQVIYVTSHDLRSPLVNVQGFERELDYSLKELLEILARLELPEDVRAEITRIINDDILDSMKYIRSSSIKMEKLLSGLLKLSRVDRMGSTYDVIEMERLMGEIINSFEFQIKEAGGTVLVEKLPACYGNEIQVNQLFSNLISNALKYRDPERPLDVTVSGHLESVNNQAIYCVKDNGIGIPRNHQTRIFDIFHRLNPEEGEGEGLGLSIVQKIVNRHSGRVWVKSKKGEGSRFFIALPAGKEPDYPVARDL